MSNNKPDLKPYHVEPSSLTLGDSSPLPDAVPPSEFRLFFKGENKTTKGTFLFDEEAANLVMSRYVTRGIKMMGDLEHQTFADPPIKAESTCSFNIELRDGELWATNIHWTKEAYEWIKTRKYIYTSAAFQAEEKTGRIVALLNFALTNLPSADRIDPLVAAKEKVMLSTKPAMKTSAKTALVVKPQKKIKSLSAHRKQKMAKFLEKIQKHLDDAKSDPSMAAKACGLSDEEMSEMLDSEEGQMAPEGVKALAKLAKHLSMPVEHLCALAMGYDPDMDEDDDSEEGDDEDGDKEEMKALKAAIITCTGKSDLTEAKAVLTAMSITHAQSSDLAKQVVQLTADLAAIKGNDHMKEFDRLVEDAKKEGKLTPAEVSSKVDGTPGAFLAMCREDHKNGLKSVKAFLSALSPKVKTLTAKGHVEPSMGSDEITEAEAEVARNCGVDLKTLAASKKAVRSI